MSNAWWFVEQLMRGGDVLFSYSGHTILFIRKLNLIFEFNEINSLMRLLTERRRFITIVRCFRKHPLTELCLSSYGKY